MRSSLGYRISINVLAVLAVVMLLTIAGLVLIVYIREIGQTLQTVEEIRKVEVPILVAAVWDMSESDIRDELNSIAAKEHVGYLELRLPAESITTGDPRVTAIRSETFTLEHVIGGEIGQLDVRFSAASIRATALRNILVLVAYLFIVFAVVALTILFVFRYQVTRHLIALAQYARGMTIGTLDREFRFENRRSPPEPDELDRLLDAFNIMRTNLALEIDTRTQAESNLRVTEEKYQHVFNATAEAIFIHEAGTGEVIDVNDTTYEMYRIPDRATPGSWAGEFCLGTDPYTADSALRRIRQAAGGQPQFFEWRARRYDGSEFWSEINLHHAEIDGQARVIASIRDVSSRKEMEQRISQSQKLEAIGTLAGGIAHDFNNVLFAILGFAEMAAEDTEPDSPVRQHLDEIMLGAQRAAELVRQILTFARRSEHARSAIQVVPVIKEVVRMLRATLPSNIDLGLEVADDRLMVVADPTELHQILINLCTNASHAMQESGGVLEISLDEMVIDEHFLKLHPELRAGRYLLLKVQDTGTGMTEEVRKRLFEPFFTTKQKGEGTGMGLAVVHGIVVDLEGAISVYSVAGEGTTIHVYLPIASQGDESAVTEPTPVPLGSESILVVDDEPSLTQLIAGMLKSLGYRVEVARNGEEALQMFQRDPAAFDLVLTDQTMPRMTGGELARATMEIRPGLPVILCTGFSKSMPADRAKELGIAAYLVKPIAKRTLAETVRDVLDREHR